MRNTGVVEALFPICIAVSVATNLAPDDIGEENLRKLALANNELACNLYRRLASDSSKNVFFSPLSISTVLGMLFYGARGETAEELRKVLGYEKAELRSDFVHETFSRFTEILHNEDSADGYVLTSANAIIADVSVKLFRKYRHNIQELYDAEVVRADISRQAPRIVEVINEWVQEMTNGKIEKLLEELSPDTDLVLLNAVYFKGTWMTQFDLKNTKDETFYNNGLESEAKDVPMMHIQAEFPMAFLQDFEAVELPYKGENVSMLILLPNKLDGFQALEQDLTPEKLAEVQESMDPFNVAISLPKFKLEFEEELSEPLTDIGANQIFGSGANFSGMTRNTGVFVNQMLHKAVIEVNEEGSEAAAVTGAIRSRNRPLTFKADHPFLFAIVEKGSKSNMVLFMGRVNNL